MKLLFMSDRERFWDHLVPVVVEMVRRGHHVAGAMAPTAPRANVQGVLEKLDRAGANEILVRQDGADSHVWAHALLTDQDWDAVMVCPDHVTPMSRVKGLSRAAGRTTPVIAIQHGLLQAPLPNHRDLIDAMLTWGYHGDEMLRPLREQGIRVVRTGTPRFDAFTPANARDEGYNIAIAGYTDAMGSEITPWWVRQASLLLGALRELRIKVHPNDHLFVAPPDKSQLKYVVWVPDWYEEVRACHAVYCSYPSTGALEAKLLGKGVILGPWAKEIFDRYQVSGLLEPGDATPRICAAIEEIVGGK